MEATSKQVACLLMKEVEAYIGELAMLSPLYVPGGGDMTAIVQKDGTLWHDPRPVPAVLKQIARYFGVDLAAVRERYGDILGKRLHVPLPLSPGLVLVPFKMRTPLVPKDGTTGYVVLSSIERVVPELSPTSCRLELKGPLRVRVLQSHDFAAQQLRNGRIVQTFYRERMKPYGGQLYSFNSFPSWTNR